jgi:hypothetical protein
VVGWQLFLAFCLRTKEELNGLLSRRWLLGCFSHSFHLTFARCSGRPVGIGCCCCASPGRGLGRGMAYGLCRVLWCVFTCGIAMCGYAHCFGGGVGGLGAAGLMGDGGGMGPVGMQCAVTVVGFGFGHRFADSQFGMVCGARNGGGNGVGFGVVCIRLCAVSFRGLGRCGGHGQDFVVMSFYVGSAGGCFPLCGVHFS